MRTVLEGRSGSLRVHAGEDGEALVLSRVRLRSPSPPTVREGTFASTDDPARFACASASASARIHVDRRGGALAFFLEHDGPPLAARDGARVGLELPGFARGLAIARVKLHWTAPAFLSDPRLLPAAAYLVVWQRAGSPQWHALAAAAGGGAACELGARDLELGASLSANGALEASPLVRAPLFAFAAGVDAQLVVREACAAALAASDLPGRARWEKPFPAALRSLGWCSWNAFGPEVDEAGVLAAARSLRAAGAPVRALLIDDGWQSVEDRKLTSFAARADAFPRGLAPLVSDLRASGFAHVGVWHTLHGYWDGVLPGSPAASRCALAERGGLLSPDPASPDDRDAFRAFYAELAEAGIDFVKVDNQANTVRFAPAPMSLDRAAAGLHERVERAAEASFGVAAVVNCMEMTIENVLSWPSSNVARSSDDYLPDTPSNVAEHVKQNAYNALWLSQFAYPDYDMFQSHDAHAAFHALARALSGGPIYVTDTPGRTDAALLRRLARADGEVLLLDEPGHVTDDCLFRDPATSGAPLKLAGGVTRPGLRAAIVAVFGVDATGADVEGVVAADDVRRFALGDDDPIVFDGARALRFGGGPLRVRLRALEATSFVIVARAGPFAVIGLADKLLPPAAVERVERVQGAGTDGDGVVVHLADAGELVVWTSSPPREVTVDGAPLAAAAWTFDGALLRVPISSAPARVQVRAVSAAGRTSRANPS